MTTTIINTTINHGVTPGYGNYGTNLTISGSGVINGSTYGVYGTSLLGSVNITNAGRVNATEFGVLLVGLASLNNFGSINGGVAGLDMRGGGLNNTGVITGGTIAVLVNENDLPVHNYGLISGGTIGLYAQSSTITNSGSITGPFIGADIEGGSFTNTSGGTISSSAGIGLAGADAYIRNDGLVTGLPIAAGMYGSGTFYNTGLINGLGIGFYLQSTLAAGASLHNSGKITALNFGVAVIGGTVVNSGTLLGLKDGVYISSSSYAAQITDTGFINGGTYAIDAVDSLALTLGSGASFAGALRDRSGNGLLSLTGSGSVSAFTGFSTIDFAAGAAWTLESSLAGLAAGQTINGFTIGDTLALDGFAATSETMTDAGLVLSDGVTTETLHLSGAQFTQNFSLSTAAGNSTIAFAPITAADLVSTINNDLVPVVTPNAGYFSSNITITNTGVVQQLEQNSTENTTINNAGEITNVVLFENNLFSNSGTVTQGVSLNEQNTVLNTGTILATGREFGVSAWDFGYVYNTGLISAAYGGVSTEIGSNVNNAGTIIGGVLLAWTLTNSGYIGSPGSSDQINGIAAEAQLLLVNAGTITSGTIGAATETLVNTGTINGTAYGVSVDRTLVNSGTISGATAVLHGEIGYGLELIAGAGAVFNGAVIDKSGEGRLTLTAGTGRLDMGTSFTGFSGISFASGALWTLEGTASDLAAGQSIAGFTLGDTIKLDGFTSNSYSYVSGTGLVLSNGTARETLAIAGTLATSDFTVTNDAEGVAITTDAAAPCFCAGTRIATSRGNIAVEALQIGDLVRTAARGLQPIRWIGRRSYEGRFIAGNHLALPVKIRRHALGFNVPSRDLFVSPDHALAEGGVLVHAWRFINGVSITQAQSVERAEYFHIELEHHAVIFAENTPVESFLDAECRGRFQNALSAPADLPPQAPCLPRVEDGYYLARLKTRIDARAGIAAPAATGPLRGCIDDAGPLLRGWAQDAAAPELPVELALLCNGQVVQHFLANRYRADLRSAGLGSGCHAFELALPILNGPLTLHRTADGVVLDQGQIIAQAS